MRIKRLGPALTLILATTGCASAVPSTTAVASATAASARGNTHITLYSVNSDGPRFQAIVTGAYRGISGGFTLTATVDEIDEKSGCTATGAFIAQVIVITGQGTVRRG